MKRNPSHPRRFAMMATAVSALFLIGATALPSVAQEKSEPFTKESDSGERHGSDEKEGEKRGGPQVCASDKSKNYTVNQVTLPFTAIPDATASFGTLKNAGYRIEIPKNWNGELVMWAHGFAGWGCDLNVDNPPMRAYLIAHGYAWAASSYAANGYAVQQGVDDTMRLIKMFKKQNRGTKGVYMTGASMGGHITGVAIEQNEDSFVGAMPVCGVMGSGKLFDFFLDYNELAQAISGVQSPYPYGVDYLPVVVPKIKAALGAPGSAKYQTLANAIEQRTGGTRPGFGFAFPTWVDFLFSLGQPNPGVVPAFPATNEETVYQLDGDPAISATEAALNESIRRVSRFDFATPDGKVPVPEIEGELHMPVLTMHTIDDLFVPFSMEQIYARRAASEGKSDLLVQRAIRDIGHCSFSEAEFNTGFEDLAAWVHTGVKAAGDDILTPSAVAAPTFGCQFTKTAGLFQGTPARAFFFTPCPAP
jgi:pimeloyl-ACP methyl ester carboxylesterase